MSGFRLTARDRRAVIALTIVCIVLAAAITGVLLDRFSGAAQSTSAQISNQVAEAEDTVVPEGETPEEFVAAYFEDVLEGNYDSAYERLPASNKASQTREEFAEALAGYEIAGYSIDGVQEEDTQAQVLVTATVMGGSMQYFWTFTKDGDLWVLTSRELGSFSE